MRFRKNPRTFRAVRQSKFVALGALLCFIAISCAKDEQKESETVTKADITIVMNAHAQELMAIPGVTGVAIGELDDKSPCILVLIREESDEISQSVPKTLEGYPVRLFVSGEIKPMDAR